MKKSLGLDFVQHNLNVGCTYQMKIEKMLQFRHKLNFVDFLHNLQNSHVQYISECKCSVGYKCIKLVFNRYAIYLVFFFRNLWNKFNSATTYKYGASFILVTSCLKFGVMETRHHKHAGPANR
jgi:hypothetical protein